MLTPVFVSEVPRISSDYASCRIVLAILDMHLLGVCLLLLHRSEPCFELTHNYNQRRFLDLIPGLHRSNLVSPWASMCDFLAFSLAIHSSILLSYMLYSKFQIQLNTNACLQCYQLCKILLPVITYIAFLHCVCLIPTLNEEFYSHS